MASVASLALDDDHRSQRVRDDARDRVHAAELTHRYDPVPMRSLLVCVCSQRGVFGRSMRLINGYYHSILIFPLLLNSLLLKTVFADVQSETSAIDFEASQVSSKSVELTYRSSYQ